MKGIGNYFLLCKNLSMKEASFLAFVFRFIIEYSRLSHFDP